MNLVILARNLQPSETDLNRCALKKLVIKKGPLSRAFFAIQG